MEVVLHIAGDVIAKTRGQGKVGKEELSPRFDKFARGEHCCRRQMLL